MKALPPKERIQKHVKLAENGCWIWFGAVRSKQRPYGRLIIGSHTDGTRRTIGAHQYAYLIYRGEIPAGMCVCHHCDNPQCVNPDHLFLGTKKDNADDRDRKGRLVPAPRMAGEGHTNSKLKWEQVLEIRSSKESSSVLAERFGMSAGQMRAVRRGDYFKVKNLPEPPTESTP